jgi:hypothetical protein
MADEDSKALFDTPTTAFEQFDALWRALYAIAGCQYAISVLDAGSRIDQLTRDKIDGLHEAIRLLADNGERLAAEAREQAPLPTIP